ncbi:MAG: high frequency lysogenization protein HflD [Cardiobacteriaceae bacterium]|nr:high frequency lysogenization protein HflD [Cardiobacteriaceae bacterium]
MKHNPIESQAWALSALFLAIQQVRTIAAHGERNAEAELCLLPSLIHHNADDIADYYGPPAPLLNGRDAFLRVFSVKNDEQGLRYSAQIMHVERRLSKNFNLMNILKKRLQGVQRQAEHFPLNHENLLANFASIYQDTASQAAGKIMITGEPQWLRQQENIDAIRTLLLCGVRAVVLWRSYGGNRLNLLFARRKLETAIRHLSFN